MLLYDDVGINRTGLLNLQSDSDHTSDIGWYYSTAINATTPDLQPDGAEIRNRLLV